MRSPLTLAVIVGTVAIVAGTAVAGPLRSGGRLTTVPPALYAGTSKAETIIGTNANDILLGRGGNDVLRGRGGNDVLRGGTGNDRLYGGAGRDVLAGDVGNDRLYARDGVRETVNGGPGFDQAWLDARDVARNVELVHRG